MEVGSYVSGGDIYGTVPENSMVVDKIMVPPHTEGKVTHISPHGNYHLNVSAAHTGRYPVSIIFHCCQFLYSVPFLPLFFFQSLFLFKISMVKALKKLLCICFPSSVVGFDNGDRVPGQGNEAFSHAPLAGA